MARPPAQRGTKGNGRADYGRPTQLRTARRRLIASQTAAIGAGIGGLSFFTVWMNRYQPYLIEVTLPASVLAAACLGSYGLLLALAMGISVLVRSM